MAPCKELCHLNKFVLRVQTGSKDEARVISDFSFLLLLSLPPPPSFLSPRVIFCFWALSHHPFSAFHSLTTPGNTRITIITFRLIPFLSPCPLKSSTFSSHRLIFLQHRFLSGPFPVQKCLLIPYSPFNNVQKSQSQNKKLQNTTIPGLWLISERKVSHTYDYVQPSAQKKFGKRFITSMKMNSWFPFRKWRGLSKLAGFCSLKE